MRIYKSIDNKNQVFESGDFKLIPIRDDDKYAIMKMRNEQIYHLRQSKPLTRQDQESYFINVVSNLFEEKTPSQLLFSFLYNNEFIGYGGLVHMNWIDKNAEISFIMKTELEKDNFELYWSNYLFLLEELTFKELCFHKIYTYAFDLRPHLYTFLEKLDYKKEAILVEHCFFENKFIDVVIHSKINIIC